MGLYALPAAPPVRQRVLSAHLTKMNESVIDELASLYGLNDESGSALDRAIRALEEAAAANKAYLILKFDGERTSKRYTTVFSASHIQAGVVRIDGDSMGECLARLLANVIELKKKRAEFCKRAYRHRSPNKRGNEAS